MTTPTYAAANNGVAILPPVMADYSQILSHDALAFLAQLERRFGGRRYELLKARAERQARIAAGESFNFLAETSGIRTAEWTVAPVPEEISDRRVEITGPVDRKLVINALNSGANVFMADFEDSLTPTWENLVQGQINLRDAVRGSIAFESPEGKSYTLDQHPAVLMVRPRGWQLSEKHVTVDSRAISGSLFDFGLFFFHNARELVARGSRPYFYLPKLESHLEARLWNEVFVFAQQVLKVPQGTIRATVLIETLPAAFEMDEILHELRDHSIGLNCGRWDYLFSCIKKFRWRSDFVFADRGLVTMTSPFMRAYSLLTIKTCHRRKAHAMGGMTAQIPIKDDPLANDAALAVVRADKEREARDGHDGTWVAHPGLVPIAREVFDRLMPGPNQLHRLRDDVTTGAAELLEFGPESPITEQGLRHNIDIGLQYLGSWLAGNGCVPIHHLMEDAATAEISRAQIWQWIRSTKGVLDDGRKVTVPLFRKLVPEELAKLRRTLGPEAYAAGKYDLAAEVFDRLTTDDDFAEFLTVSCYDYLD